MSKSQTNPFNDFEREVVEALLESHLHQEQVEAVLNSTP